MAREGRGGGSQSVRWFHHRYSMVSLIVCVEMETKEHLSTMTSPVHVDNVTQWLQTTRVLSYS